ncbi:uncharacterized protein LOC132752869 [Ruditapes philippinarum]|uniref:uncharacterized protein LOC132752869 n=1 Tax=Ruditapes philippinarum TaxID=129788 RepID=UPI00295AC733|nr:uncharacterized protein LOC132752869 [Ruditapes philippinarum]
MTASLTKHSVISRCLLIFISHAAVASQKMEETENIGARLDFDTNQDILLHDNLGKSFLSFEPRILENSMPFLSKWPSQPYHLKNLIFKSFKNKGKLENDVEGNHLKTFLSKGKEMKKNHDIVYKQRRVLQHCLRVRKSINRSKQCYHILHQYYLINSDLTIKHENKVKNSDVYRSIKFRNRKLLSSSVVRQRNVKNVPKSAKLGRRKFRSDSEIKQLETGTNIKQRTESIPLNISSKDSNASKVNLEKLALQELKEYEEFVSMMEQTFSKDPLRAMLSVSFLLIVMMLAVKLCGMKPMKQERENLDFHENVHYLNIHDILKRKRPYLPKYLLTWERRLRRKFKRRQRIKRVREQEEQAENVMTDNSEEEMLIYGGNCDF